MSRSRRSFAESRALWRQALRRKLGLLRSVAIYNLKPLNRRRLRDFYRPLVKPGDLCFDVGAHVGNRTRAWLELGARVVSVEPQPVCIERLRREFSGYARWRLCPQAIGEHPGSATLIIATLNPAVSTLSPSWQREIAALDRFEVPWDETATVDVTTLDQLIAEHGVPGFCKLDVEDYELPALRGLSRPLPALSFEFYPTTLDKAIACLDRLEELGRYEYNWSIAESLRMRSQNWLDGSDMRRLLQRYRGRKSGDVYARALALADAHEER